MIKKMFTHVRDVENGFDSEVKHQQPKHDILGEVIVATPEELVNLVFYTTNTIGKFCQTGEFPLMSNIFERWLANTVDGANLPMFEPPKVLPDTQNSGMEVPLVTMDGEEVAKILAKNPLTRNKNREEPRQAFFKAEEVEESIEEETEEVEFESAV